MSDTHFASSSGSKKCCLILLTKDPGISSTTLNTLLMLSYCLRQLLKEMPVFSATSSMSFLLFEVNFLPRTSLITQSLNS